MTENAKVHLVMGKHGDWQTWEYVVAVYLDEAQAQLHADLANLRGQAIDQYRGSDAYFHDADDVRMRCILNEFDPENNSAFEPRFSVHSVALRDRAPEPA